MNYTCSHMDLLIRILIILTITIRYLIRGDDYYDEATTKSSLQSTTTKPKGDANLAGYIIIAIVLGTVTIFVLVLLTCFCCCRKKIQAAKQEAEELARARETVRLINTAKEKNAPIPELDPQRKRSTLKDLLVCLISPQKSAAKTRTLKTIASNKRKEKQILTNQPPESPVQHQPKTLPASENQSSVVPLQVSQVGTSKNEQIQQQQQHPSKENPEVLQIGLQSSDCRSKETVNQPRMRKTLTVGVTQETRTRAAETNKLSTESTKKKDDVIDIDKTQESNSIKTKKVIEKR